MKLLVLLCLVGYALSSSIGSTGTRGVYWNPNTEYIFEYNGRLLTGLPELATHFSGMGIRCKVHLHVQEGVTGYRFGIHITEAKYVKVNDRLHGDETKEGGNNWRYVLLPDYSDLPSEHSQVLSNQIVLKLKPTGEFEVMVVKDNEPEWAINFKKALANLLQTKFYPTEFSQGQSVQTNELISDSDEEVTSWKTKEESLDGVCEVTYQMNEMPTYVTKDLPSVIPYPELCQRSDGKYYEVIKTRDIDSCIKRTSFNYYKPGFFRCPTGNCDGMWSRSSITRYTACGSRDKLMIQTITNEGELQQSLLGTKTEKFMTGTRQVMKLITTRSSSSGIVEPVSSRVLNTLFYEYTKVDLMNPELNNETYISELMKGMPRSIMTTGNNGKGIEPSKLVPEMKRIFREIVNEDLHDLVNIPKKQITMKALNMARGFSLLKIEDIRNIYNELKGSFSTNDKQTMFKNVFFDCLVMGGSTSNIMFLKEKIESGELSTSQIVSIFALLPQYVITPNQDLLHNLFTLITSDTIKSKPMLHNHSLLSFSTLIQRACLNNNRRTSYPTFVYGEFCTPDSEIVTEKWLPYLRRELESTTESTIEKRNLIIVSLGLMSHKNVIPMLLPYVESRQSSSESESRRLTRFLATYALTTPGYHNPQLVIPIFYSIFNNLAECTQIRVAAFNSLIKLNAPMPILQGIVSSTWREKDTEVLNVVNTAFFSLRNEWVYSKENVKVGFLPKSSTIERNAWLLYPLIKKTGGKIPTSGTTYTNDYLTELGVGYENTLSWTSSKDSIVPSNVYSKMVFFLNRFQFAPFEYGYNLNGAENLIHQLVKILSPESVGTKEEIIEKVKGQLHDEWKQVIENLGIKSRDTESSSGAIFFNLYESFPFFRSFESTTTEMLKEKVWPFLKSKSSLKEKFCGQTNVNFQRMHNLAPTEFMIPSDMGLPMLVEVHQPITISLTGNLNVDCSTRVPSVHMNLRTLFASQMTGWVGTICPFTEESVVTGVDEHAVVNVPAEFKIDVNIPEKKLSVKLTPLTSVSQPVDIFHFHVRPYTVAQRYYNLMPMTLNRQVKFIESRTPSQSKILPIGESYGLGLKVILTTETRFVDVRSMYERLRMYNFNPINILRFGWVSSAVSETGYPSIRKHEMQIRYNPSESSTKEIKSQVELDWISKEKDEHIVKTHEVKVVEDESKIVPYKIEKVPVSYSHSEKTQKVKELLERTGLRYGHGISLRWSLLLTGSRTQTYTYNTRFVAGGESSYKSKWNMQLESEKTNKKVCVSGELDLPKLPVWNIEEIRNTHIQLHYHNEIGFGTDCSESKVVVTGSTRTSEKQKEWSKISPDAKLLERMIEKNVPLTKLSQVADKVRVQATTLDEVDFRVEYVNVPHSVMVGSKYVIEMVKSMWWPFMITENTGLTGSPVRSSMTSTWKFWFNPSTRTFDLTISRPDGKIVFSNVRIPTYFGYFFPMTSLRNPISSIVKKVSGRPLHPICSLEKEWVSTFDNRTTELKLDDCFHLLSADCSLYKRFSVLVRSLTKTSQTKEMKIFLGKTSVVITPTGRHSRYQNVLEVRVNGTEITLTKGQTVIIRDEHKTQILELTESTNGVITLNSKWIKVIFDGYKTQLETSSLIKDKLCGLCGDCNGQKLADLRGPKKCVYSKPELLSASYRVSLPSKRCDPLPSHIESKLRSEESTCLKYKELPTKVSKSFKLATGECTQHQHEIIEKPSKVCFSTKPVPNCSPRCKPQSGEVIKKTIDFACLDRSERVVKLYIEKVRSNKVVPELENLTKSFSVEMTLPKVCVPVNRLI